MESITCLFGHLTLNTSHIIKIQANMRRYLVQKKLRKDDIFNLEMTKVLLNSHIQKKKTIDGLNAKLINRKIRNDNFPSEISENIVKYAMFKKYNIMPSWDTKCGDLMILNYKIEVKAFSSIGPSSFGPTEYWDCIYFLDAIDYVKYHFIVYEIKLASISDIWSNIKVNKSETMGDQIKQKRRPRLSFKNIKDQINGYVCVIFDGHIDELTHI
jgi:hypothetical protein